MRWRDTRRLPTDPDLRQVAGPQARRRFPADVGLLEVGLLEVGAPGPLAGPGSLVEGLPGGPGPAGAPQPRGEPPSDEPGAGLDLSGLETLAPSPGPGNARPRPGNPRPGRFRRVPGTDLLVAGSGLVAAVLVRAPGSLGPVPLALPIILAGLWLAVGLPCAQLCVKGPWGRSDAVERIAYSLAATVLLLMLGGLALDTALPPVGVPRPLATVPILAFLVTGNLALAAWRPRRWTELRAAPAGAGVAGATRAGRRRPTRRAVAVVAASVAVVGLAVVGAIRLNNGAGAGATLVMLAAAAVVLTLLHVWNRRLGTGAVGASIYLIALALLLMTSLRGWYITGHDIQREYAVFSITNGFADWSMDRYPDAYNACLSITILPTILARMTRISDPYVYKVVVQLLFAFSAVVVHRIARRFLSDPLAVTAAVYFVAFPTFFTDMPFLDRQEIAFLFVGAALLALTNEELPVRRRRSLLAGASVGMALSHYSTTYFFLGTILGYLSLRAARRVAVGLRRRVRRAPQREGREGRERLVRGTPAVGVTNAVFLVAVIAIWTGLITGTAGGVASTLKDSVGGLIGADSSASRSSDVSYSLLSSAAADPRQRLAEYRDWTLDQTGGADRPPIYYTQAELGGYPTALLPPESLPAGPAGTVLASAGVPVDALNTLLRQGAARMLQLFVLIGLAATLLLGRRRGMRMTREFFLLACGTLLLLAAQVLLPALSVDYGLLRAFQQGLFTLGPFLVWGSVAVFLRFGARFATRAAAAVALLFFLSLTGFFSQLLGRYPAQLNLNNAGSYYELYYTHREEVVAARWLRDQMAAYPHSSGQPFAQTDLFARDRLDTLTGLALADGIFPTLLRKDSYVLLGYSVTRDGQAAVSIGGDTLVYRYPIALLTDTRDLIYTNGSVEVYR